MAKKLIKRAARVISKKFKRPQAFKATRRHHQDESAQDYVEIVGDLIAQHGEARTCQIADELGISHVTAIRTISRLQARGYLSKAPHRPVLLTKKGAALAKHSKERHRLLVEFLKRLGVPEEVAEVDIEGAEHHFSAVTLGAIKRFMRLVLVLASFYGFTTARLAYSQLVRACEPRAEDISCEISIAELTKLRQRKDFVVVDVRDESDFQRLRIPASISFPLYALKTKEYFKSSHVLLIGDAYASGSLADACFDLRKRGFSQIAYLKGGLLTWQKHFGVLDGDKTLIAESKTISAQALYREMYYRPWLFVDISLAAGEEKLKSLGETDMISLPYERPLAKFQKRLASEVKEHLEKSPGAALALLTDLGPVPDNLEIEGLLFSAGLEELYLVEGGKSAVERHAAANRNSIEHIKERQRESQCR